MSLGKMFLLRNVKFFKSWKAIINMTISSALAPRLKFVLLGAIFAGISCTAAGAVFPTLEDSQSHGFLEASKTEYEKYLASPDAYFAHPSEAKPWPCDLTPAQLSALAETVNSDDDPVLKRELLIDARSSGGEPPSITFSKQVFYPLQATCKANKLEGLVDFWVEFDRAIISKGFTANDHMLKRMRFTAKAGEAVGTMAEAGKTISSNVVWNDPETAEIMAGAKNPVKTSVWFAQRQVLLPRQSRPPMVVISHISVNGAITLTVREVRNLGDKRVQVVGYGQFGALSRRDYVQMYKDGKLHGAQISYGGMMGRFPIPPSQDCYEDGQKILTADCKVD